VIRLRSIAFEEVGLHSCINAVSECPFRTAEGVTDARLGIRRRCIAVERRDAAATLLSATVTSEDNLTVLRGIAAEGPRPVAWMSATHVVERVAEKVAGRELCLLICQRVDRCGPSRHATPTPASGASTPWALRSPTPVSPPRRVPGAVAPAQPAPPLPKSVDCKAGWAEAERPMKEIAKEADPFTRNNMISAAYAKVYQQAPHLEWFGAAAFASKQVGCGMAHARDVANSWLPKVTDAIGITKDSELLAKATVQKLGDGNKMVFEEMYPAQQFYKKHGIDGLKRCASERNPPLPDKIVQGFTLANEGRAENNPSKIHKGAETILWQEQIVTLQKAAYDDALLERALKENQKWSESWLPTFGLAQPNMVVFDAECVAADAPFFEKTGGNLADPAWRWDFARGTTQAFSDLAAGQPGVVASALRTIAAGL
jgi:hypothetical protein